MDAHEKNILKEFNRLYKELDGFYHELALSSGLSDSAFSILYAIAEFGDGCLQTEIAKSFNISVQTIHTSAKNLEKKGYLVFCPGKKREMHLCLTEAGRELSEEKILPVIKLENSIFTEMGREESEQLLRLSERYVEIFRKKIDGIL